MKSGKILFTTLLLTGLLADAAAAAQKGLILLGNLEHSVDLSYQFGRQDVSGGGRQVSSTQHRFQEIYNLDTNFALYNERIFKARVSAKAKGEQEYFNTSATGDSSTKSVGFLYNLYGVVLERGYTPVKLSALSEQTRVSNSFSPGYDLYTDSYGIGTTVRNKIVPISLDFNRYNSRTEGLAQDRVQTNNQVALTASHMIPAISQTDLLMYRTDTASELEGGGGNEDQRVFQLQFKNNLSTRDNRFSLLSGVRVREEMDRVKSGNVSWQESMSWRLGKALSMGLGYGTDTSSQEDATTGSTTRRTSHTGNFSLAHQLYQNFTSRFNLSGRWAELSNGTEDEYSGQLSFGYTRSLPRDARFALGYSHLRTLVDRNLTSANAPTTETLAVRRGVFNQLSQPNVLRITRVRDLNAGLEFTEASGAFQVDTQGAFTGLIIPVGSPILDGSTLTVEYEYLVNPSIKYLSTSHNVSSSLFWGGRHRLFASFDTSNQELISGRTDLLELNDSIGLSVGFHSEIYRIAYGVENNYVDSTLDKHNATEGFARFSYPFRFGTLLGQVRDRYAVYSETASNPERRQENTFSVTANYTRPVLTTGVLVVTGSFADTRGGRFSRDDAELMADFQWSYSKLLLKVTGKVNWRDLAGITSLENYFTFEVKRYF